MYGSVIQQSLIFSVRETSRIELEHRRLTNRIALPECSSMSCARSKLWRKGDNLVSVASSRNVAKWDSGRQFERGKVHGLHEACK